MTTTIHLNEILTAFQEITDAGEKFYAEIMEAKPYSDRFLIDMTEVTSLPSIFLNVSFGKIIDDLGMEAVRTMFSFSNITKAQAERLKKYFAAYKS